MQLTEQELKQIDNLEWNRKEAGYKKEMETLKIKLLELVVENSKLKLEMQRIKGKEAANVLSEMYSRKRKFFDELRKAYNIEQEVFGFDPDTGEIILDEVKK